MSHTLFQHVSGLMQRPRDVEEAINELWRAALEHQAAIDEINASFFSLTYAAPDKPREGMIRFADGTVWNPGAGKGLYQYRGGTWNKL